MSFRYELRRPSTRRLSKAWILKGLRAFARRQRGRPFRTVQFEAWPGRPCSMPTVIKHFGSWNKALAAVNVRPVVERSLDADRLIAELERIWRLLGCPPRERDVRKHGRFKIDVYKRRWGSVRKCCVLIAAHRRGELSRAALLASAPRTGTRKWLSPATRLAILKRDRFRCVFCADSPAISPTCELHIDHILPLCRGGGNEIENLRTLCSRCNQGRRHGTGDGALKNAARRRAAGNNRKKRHRTSRPVRRSDR